MKLLQPNQREGKTFSSVKLAGSCDSIAVFALKLWDYLSRELRTARFAAQTSPVEARIVHNELCWIKIFL